MIVNIISIPPVRCNQTVMSSSNRRAGNTSPAAEDINPNPAIATRAEDHKRPFHHGSLPGALLAAAEVVLLRDGLKGLTLRAIAREAGVSHTAPKHHFGDVANVLSELAAVGHLRLAQRLADSADDLPHGQARRSAIARGYVMFGVENPGLFRLMDRNEMLDYTRPSLLAASRVSALALAGVFETPDAATSPDEGKAFAPLSASQAVAMTAAWGYVHGLTSLLIDNRLDAIVGATASFTDALSLVEAAIGQTRIALDSPTID